MYYWSWMVYTDVDSLQNFVSLIFVLIRNSLHCEVCSDVAHKVSHLLPDQQLASGQFSEQEALGNSCTAAAYSKRV